MRGLMSERPLLISAIITHAARYHGDTEIVSRTRRRPDPPLHLSPTPNAVRDGSRGRLLRLGIEPGDRVGTLAWNTFRHFELYYGISGIGAVCHTINPRLFDEQIVYIVNHARRPAAVRRHQLHPAGRAPRAANCRPIAASSCSSRPRPAPSARATSELVAAESEEGSPGPNSTNGPRPRCATPREPPAGRRASLYSHRSTVLHAYGVSLPDAIPISSRRTRSARSCRCSTPAAGASLTSRR